MAGMAENCCKWPEIAGMTGYGWKLQKTDGNCWKWLEWLEIPGNAWKCLKLLEMTGNALKWLEMTGMARNYWKWLETSGMTGDG